MADFGDDLALLADAFERDAPSPAEVDATRPDAALETWLRRLRTSGVGALLLLAGSPPLLRHDGTLTPLSDFPLDDVEIDEAQPAHPRGGQIESQRRAETTGADA